jgi:hypothetical protein
MSMGKGTGGCQWWLEIGLAQMLEKRELFTSTRLKKMVVTVIVLDSVDTQRSFIMLAYVQTLLLYPSLQLLDGSALVR